MNYIQPLPYKFVIFKNSIQNGDWDCADIHSFDQKSDPTLSLPEDSASTSSSTSIFILSEFCVSALEAIQRYLEYINKDVSETPKGYAWCIRSVHIERGEDGLVSCKEFAIVVELVNRMSYGAAAESVSDFGLRRSPVSGGSLEHI
ncbi:hypothetical protein ABW19_dt0204582 [Dactylella cylindrospora]|nr:hypothetical protein ABW19_dt0204582 [Dactylella cylindrospora]